MRKKANTGSNLNILEPKYPEIFFNSKCDGCTVVIAGYKRREEERSIAKHNSGSPLVRQKKISSPERNIKPP